MTLILEPEPRAPAVLRIVRRFRDEDLGIVRQAFQDFRLYAVVEADLDRGGRLRVADPREMHERAAVLHAHRFARDEQGALALADPDLDRGRHARIDAAEDVAFDPDSDLEDDDVRVDLAAGENEVDPALELFLGAAREGDLDGLADLDLGDVGFV